MPDEADKLQANLARTSSLDESLHPSRAPSIPPPVQGVSPISQDPAAFYADGDKGPVSPLEPQGERKPSVGGNYFPEVPVGTQHPAAATNIGLNLPVPPGGQPAQPAHQSSGSAKPNVSTTVPPIVPHPTSTNAPQHHGLVPPPSSSASQHIPPPIAGPPPGAPLSPPVNSTPQGPFIPQSTAPPASQPAAWNVPAEVNEEAMLSAQKHCRWAISALNFEDVPTAVKELRGALKDLGAL